MTSIYSWYDTWSNTILFKYNRIGYCESTKMDNMFKESHVTYLKQIQHKQISFLPNSKLSAGGLGSLSALFLCIHMRDRTFHINPWRLVNSPTTRVE